MYTRKIGYGGKTITFGGANINTDINVPVLYDGSTYAWFQYDKLSTITFNQSGDVSVWTDFLDAGKTISIPRSLNGPSYNSIGGLTFNNSTAPYEELVDNDFSLNQPFSVYAVMKQETMSYGATVFSFNYDVYTYVRQLGDDVLYMRAGSTGVSKSGVKLKEWQICEFVFNGTDSYIRLNNDSSTSGDAGTDGLNRISFTLGGSGNGGSVSFKELIIRGCVDSPEAEQKISNYLKYKYNIDMDKLYGRELVYNGTFDTSAKWATSSGALPSAGWSIVDNKLYCDGTNFTICAPLADDNQNFLVLMPGAKYIMECDVSATGTCAFFGPNTGSVFLENGHNSIIFTYGPSFNNWFEGWDSFVGSIDNISVRQYFG